MVTNRKFNKPKELTEEQFSKLMEDLDNFDNNFITNLAGTGKYEIIQTVLEDGTKLTKEQYALIKTECSRLGLKVIYQIPLTNGDIVFINPDNLKIGYIRESIH